MFYSNRTLEDARDCLLGRTGQGRLGRAMNLVGDGENIMKCKEMIDNSVKYFQVCYPVYCLSLSLIYSQLYTSISLRMDNTDWRGTEGKGDPTYVVTIAVHSTSDRYVAELFTYHHSQSLPKFSSGGKRLSKRSYGSSTEIQPVASH